MKIAHDGIKNLHYEIREIVDFGYALQKLGIPITWGGDWTTTVDRPHFELKR